jgi:uncharacterized protein YtpQ (UPF0354 family)
MDRLLARNCSRDEFLLLYVRLLQERMPKAKLEMVGETAVRVVDAEGKESTTYMDNAWLTYSRNPSARRESLDRYVRVAASLNEPPEGIRKERIVPIIKDSEYLAMAPAQKLDPAREHLCGDLWIVYAQDLPDSIKTIEPEHLSEAGVDETSVRQLALENLRRILPPTERHGDGPWYMLTAGGDYTASLLLYDGLWVELSELVDGDVVAVAPSRDVLLFTGTRSPEGLKAIREQAAEIVSSGSYVISETLVVRSGGRWDVYKPN